MATTPQSFEVESTVEVTLESSTLSEVQSFNTFVTRNFISIPAGATSGTGSIEMTGVRDDDVTD